MFQGWGFLLSEVAVLLLVALLLGLFVGWLIWGRRSTVAGADTAELDRLRAELRTAKARCEECESAKADLQSQLASATAAATTAAMAEAGPAPEPASEPEPAPEPAPEPSVDATPADDSPGTKPATLSAARDGAPDDLKRIKGIGPKLEQLCHRLGFYHFDQIAAWTDDEIAWVDANLESFKGRVTRDDWVAQARVLAAEQD